MILRLTVVEMPMFKKNRNKISGSRGFTLIELLVTTALTMVLAGGALAAYNNFNTRQGQIQASKNVLATIERAKARSNAGEKPASCTRLDGFHVWATDGNSSYFVAIRCDGTTAENESQQFFLPSGYIFQSGFNAVFPPLPGNAATEEQSVEIVKTGDDQVYRFVIRPNGTIEDQGLQAP